MVTRSANTADTMAGRGSHKMKTNLKNFPECPTPDSAAMWKKAFEKELRHKYSVVKCRFKKRPLSSWDRAQLNILEAILGE